MGAHQVHKVLTTPYGRKFLRLKARELLHWPEFRGEEFLDIQQELAVRILEQAHYFDPARGAVATFIGQVAYTAAALMCRERNCIKRGRRLRHQSLDAPLPSDDDPPISLRDLLTEDDGGRVAGIATAPPDRREALMDFYDVIASLSPEQRGVAALLMYGGCETSISTALKISRRRVRAAIAVIRERLKDADLDHF